MYPWQRPLKGKPLEGIDKKTESVLSGYLRDIPKLSNEAAKTHRFMGLIAAGTDISATRVDTSLLGTQFVNDHTLYRADFGEVKEADYITGILNSTPVNQSIKPFQSMGLQGERHVHKKVLELPIPLFRSTNKLHSRLAALSAEAHQAAADFVATVSLQKTLARQRAAVRAHLKPVMDEIDLIVRQLLAK
jgi:hypothetical protein